MANVEYVPEFLSTELVAKVREMCDSLEWHGHNRRENQTFSRKPSTYTVSFSGRTYTRTTRSWRGLKVMRKVRKLVEAHTRARFNYVAIMRYPSGKVGIKPHRDREMVPGTIIAGLSIGAERDLVFCPITAGSAKKFTLANGSLYVIKPPTNDTYTHSIPVDLAVTGVRYSLTFRDCPLQS